MVNLRKLLIAGLVSLGVLVCANEARGETKYSLDNSFFNKYMWKGIHLGENPVWQTQFNAERENVTVSLFANSDLEDGEINEFDVDMDYTKHVNNNSFLSAGFTYYTFRDEDHWDNDRELYVKVGADMKYKPEISYHMFFGSGLGEYIEGAVSRDFDVGGFNINTRGAVGHNNTKYRDKNGFSHAEGKIGFTLPLSERLSTTPEVIFSKALNSDLRDEAYGGISFSYEF